RQQLQIVLPGPSAFQAGMDKRAVGRSAVVERIAPPSKFQDAFPYVGHLVRTHDAIGSLASEAADVSPGLVGEVLFCVVGVGMQIAVVGRETDMMAGRPCIAQGTGPAMAVVAIIVSIMTPALSRAVVCKGPAHRIEALTVRRTG